MAEEQFRRIFGANLKQFRESRGMSRQMLATDCGCSMHTIQSYELGNSSPVFKQLCLICNTGRISPNVLFTGLPPSSETDTIRDIQTLLEPLTSIERQRVNNFLNIMIDCRLQTMPRLTGAKLGTRVQLLRLNVGMEIEELAARCAIAKSTLQGYESGQYDPSIPALLHLCRVFSVSPEYLMANELEHTDCSDRRFLDLFPNEIKAVRDMAKYAVQAFLNYK